MDKKYCDGLDCAMCGESEHCIYRETNELQKQVHALEKECEELKQTLTEIEEITEDFYLDGEHVKDKYLAQEILQKISEVENEYNIKNIRHINKNQEYIT